VRRDFRRGSSGVGQGKGGQFEKVSGANPAPARKQTCSLRPTPRGLGRLRVRGEANETEGRQSVVVQTRYVRPSTIAFGTTREHAKEKAFLGLVRNPHQKRKLLDAGRESTLVDSYAFQWSGAAQNQSWREKVGEEDCREFTV